MLKPSDKNLFEINWKPFLKGIYNLFIGGKKIRINHKLVVLADEIDM